MSFDQLLLAGVAFGLALVGVTLFVGRKDRPARSRRVPASGAESGTEATTSSDDPVARLTETVNALQRLAALKESEVARDTEVREEIRTGWRPVSDLGGGFSRPVASPENGGGGGATTLPADAPIIREVSQVRLDPSTKIHPDSISKLRLSVGQAFSPAAPISRRDLFAGREQQLETLIDVVFERGQHAIVYGERGVGKTSLATILAVVLAEERNKLPLRVNCDASDDYSSLWHKVVDELEAAIETWEIEIPKEKAAVERALAKAKLGPSDVIRLLKQLASNIELVVFVDEFDTMTDEKGPRLFADTIKMLSDQLVPSTLIILGIADTLDELMAEHGSVHRSLVHVHMPRMSFEELKEIVTRGLDLLTMDIDGEALDLIAYLSQGFPHFTHLLAQAAARAAIDEQRPLVTMDDVNQATTKVSSRIEAWIEDAYEKATASAHESIYPQVLLAGALAHNDERGYFAPADLKAPMTGIMGKNYDIPSFVRQLNALTEPDRGPVLIRTGAERKHRYRFLEPQFEPYVLMRSLNDGVITTDRLADLLGASPAVAG